MCVCMGGWGGGGGVVKHLYMWMLLVRALKMMCVCVVGGGGGGGGGQTPTRNGNHIAKQHMEHTCPTSVQVVPCCSGNLGQHGEHSNGGHLLTGGLTCIEGVLLVVQSPHQEKSEISSRKTLDWACSQAR